jgi:AcrR family transcriptional regulator
MTSLRVKMNAERTDATRAKLLEHARRVFEERGYGGASVAHIVNAAGVARGTFYVHFQSKREIFVAVASVVRAELLVAQMRPMEQSATVADTIRNAIEHYLRAYEQSARMITLIEEMATSDPAVHDAWIETRDALQANTIYSLDRLRARGLARYTGDTRTLAMTIGGMVERMGAIRYVLGYQFDDDEYFATITSAYVDAARIVGDYQLLRRGEPVDEPAPRAASHRKR